VRLRLRLLQPLVRELVVQRLLRLLQHRLWRL